MPCLSNYFNFSYNGYESSLKNTIYQALDFKNLFTDYTFLDALNVLHIFCIFESYTKHSSVNGNLSQK